MSENKVKQKLIEKLELFNEEYQVEGNQIILRVNNAIDLLVIFKGEFFSIEGRVVRLNFLTGLLKMSVNKLYRYLSMIPILSSILILIIFLFYENKDKELNGNHLSLLLGIYIVLFSWIIITYFKFLFDYKSKKAQLVNWLDSK
jgi:hypothetical protein